MTGVDVLTVKIEGETFTGWQDVYISSGIEVFPRYFSIRCYVGLSEQYRIEVGTPVELSVDGVPVLTGFIELVIIDIGPDSITYTVRGRSRGCDLVDCSAVVVNADGSSQVNVSDGLKFTQCMDGNPSAVDIIKKLSAASGIDVKLGSGVTIDHAVAQQYPLSITDTPYSHIEKISRYEGLLLYDDGYGDLRIDKLGQSKTATTRKDALDPGGRTIRQQIVNDVSQMYSDYYVYSSSVFAFADGQAAMGPMADSPKFHGHAQEAYFNNRGSAPGTRRYRPYVIVSEAPADNPNNQPVSSTWNQARADWERNRRYGRAFQVTLIVSGWHDTNGTLWDVNRFITVPLKGGEAYLISEVVFTRSDRDGTNTQLTLVKPEAFSIEPTELLVGTADATAAINGGQ